MSAPSDGIILEWKDSFAELLENLRNQREYSKFANNASRVALAVLELLESGETLTIQSVVDYAKHHCAPPRGRTGQSRQSFDDAECARRVWPVVAALKAEHPGQALIYIQ